MKIAARSVRSINPQGPYSSQSAITADVNQAERVEAESLTWAVLWARCWNRIRNWRLPPRWTVREWHDEARAQGALAHTLARRDFDPTRRVPFEAFVYQRVVDAVWTRYRQEWSFGRRAKPLEFSNTDSEVLPILDNDGDDQMALALTRLNETERQLIHCLFWAATSLEKLSIESGLSQETLRKRKSRTLLKLRRILQV